MQVLKEEIRRRIFQAAVSEFSEKGYARASMRGIAQNAGMTVGNLYRYFKDKEDLFYSVISPAYESLSELVKKSIKQVSNGIDTRFFGFISEQILKICKEHKNELLILFEGSKGTRYEKAKEEMVLLVEDFLKGYLMGKLEDAYLLKVIATGFVEGMIMIAKKYDSDEKLREVSAQFIAFYFSEMENRF